MKQKLQTVKELLSFFATHGRWWLLPMVLVLVILGGLILLGETSVIAPLVYPLF